MRHARDILTKRQRWLIGSTHWFGTALAAIPCGLMSDDFNELARRRREVARLTRRGYLRRGRVTMRGHAVINAREWDNPTLRALIKENGRV